MPEPSHRIVIADLDVPFTRLVAFFVKVAFAAIPAAIIVAIVLRLIALVLAEVLIGFGLGPFGRW
jgi:hypothetical protein